MTHFRNIKGKRVLISGETMGAEAAAVSLFLELGAKVLTAA